MKKIILFSINSDLSYEDGKEMIKHHNLLHEFGHAWAYSFIGEESRF